MSQDETEVIQDAACLLSVVAEADRLGSRAAAVARDAVVRHVREALGAGASASATERDVLKARVRRIVKHLLSEVGTVQPPGPLTTGYDLALEHAAKLLVAALNGEEPKP